jgi:NAD-dependent DNA ligase
MASMTRKEAEVLVKAHGGKVSKSVNKNLNYLVLGDKDMPRYESGWRSSKLKKAEALKEFVQVLSESDFLSLLSK